MPAVIISDASCLILLHKIGELELLRAIYGHVVTTRLVANEYGLPLPEWISIRNPEDKIRQLILESSLDSGEASTVALALEQEDCLLIIDERKGRKIAGKLGLNFTGSIGLIADAKLSGIIPAVLPFLQKIRQTNFRLSPQLEQLILARVGEAEDQ